MYRTDFWTLWEKARVGCFKRTASKYVYYLGWNRSPAQVGCMRQALGPGALGRPRGIGWRGRWEGGSGWGTHVNPWLIHFNVWQNPLQLKKKKEREVGNDWHGTPFLLGHITENDACMLKHPLWVMSRASFLVLSSPICGSSETHKFTTFPMAAHSDWGTKFMIAYTGCCLLSLKACQLSRIEYIFFRFICWFVTAKWASLVAQLVKNHLQCRRPQFDPWVGKISWRRAWQPIPVFLPGESPGTK